MSYILNALKHSENQRNRGEVPHIDSQPEFVKVAPSKWSEPFWKWLALVAVAILLLGLVWLKFGGQAGGGAATSRPVAASPAAATSPPAVEQAPGLPALTGMAGVRISLGEDEVAGAATATPVTPALSESPRVVLEMPVARGVAPAPAAAAPAAVPARPPAPVAEPTPPAEVLTGVSHWKTLPSEVQKELREMAFTAHIYSSKPDSRFIRVSGRTLHEGDLLAPGLKLVQITRDGIVFTRDGEKYWFGAN